MNTGAWWNFGFSPPYQATSPRDDKEYMWSTPFLLGKDTSTYDFIAFSPAPNLFNYPDTYKSFAQLDMPLTYFEHIEYRFSNNPSGLEQLKQMANFLNGVRTNSEYNFMTQEQMAKSFINTFKSRATVKINSNGLEITEDTSLVPKLAEEYKGTLGIKFERGEKNKDTPLATTSDIYFEKDDSLYFGIGDGTNILFSQPKTNDFCILRSNVPFKLSGKDTKQIKLLSSGMQQIKIYSKTTPQITGEDLKIEQKDQYYTITHYGKAITITIK